MLSDISNIPDPSFIDGETKGNAFIPNPLDYSSDEVLLYKTIIAKMIERNPLVHPDELFKNQMPADQFVLLSEDDQKEEYKRQGNRLFAQIRSIFEDEEFILEIADTCDCNFMDIIKCMYAYFGTFLFKKPQFIRWMKKVVNSYSNASRRFLEIPEERGE